jgi:ABC-type lipoprotein export system ATPase subunit
VTHDRGLAASADRVLEMRDGKLLSAAASASATEPASRR